MTKLNWVKEQAHSNQDILDNSSNSHIQDLSHFLSKLPYPMPLSFTKIVDWIITDCTNLSDLKIKIYDLILEMQLGEENIDNLIQIVRAEALFKSPSLETWKNIRKISNDKWHLDCWLIEALPVFSEFHLKAEEAYIKVALEVIFALDNHELSSEYDRRNEQRNNLLNNWKNLSETKKLDEIWWGLRGNSTWDYEEYPLFQVLWKLSPEKFINTLQEIQNPYIVDAAFFATGIYEDFNEWKKLVNILPIAFNSNTKWNGSYLLPLALVVARDQLLKSERYSPNVSFTENQRKEQEQQIKKHSINLIKEITTILSYREDASSLFARWSTWLMRQLLSRGTKYINDIHTSSFIDYNLIEEIGRTIFEKNLTTPECIIENSDWEPWSYQCVLASHANSKFIPLPDSTSFINEWKLTIDDWNENKGKQLRKRAEIFIYANNEIPGDFANYIVSPSVLSSSAVDNWKELWELTYPLREIVEFGYPDNNKLGKKYDSSTEANKLLWLVFQFGLATFDQLINLNINNISKAMELYSILIDASHEMQQIDYFIDREKWLKARQLLAIKHLLLENYFIMNDKDSKNMIDIKEAKLTFSEFLKNAEYDPEELLGLIQIALENISNQQIIKDKILDAKIDLKKVIQTAFFLNSISPTKYPFNKDQLNQFKDLITI